MHCIIIKILQDITLLATQCLSTYVMDYLHPCDDRSHLGKDRNKQHGMMSASQSSISPLSQESIITLQRFHRSPSFTHIQQRLGFKSWEAVFLNTVQKIFEQKNIMKLSKCQKRRCITPRAMQTLTFFFAIYQCCELQLALAVHSYCTCECYSMVCNFSSLNCQVHVIDTENLRPFCFPILHRV